MAKEENNEIKKEQLMMEVQMIQQRAQQAEEQLKVIDEQVGEMEELSESIKKLGEENNRDKEMMFPIGRGIFIKGIPKGEKLLVNVGSGIAVEKNHEDAIKIIDKQIIRLIDMKRESEEELMSNSLRIQEIVQELYTEE